MSDVIANQLIEDKLEDFLNSLLLLSLLLCL